MGRDGEVQRIGGHTGGRNIAGSGVKYGKVALLAGRQVQCSQSLGKVALARVGDTSVPVTSSTPTPLRNEFVKEVEYCCEIAERVKLAGLESVETMITCCGERP